VAVNHFVGTPAQKPFLSKAGKNSGERILNLRLKEMKSDILLKFLSLREVFFYTASERFIINSDLQNSVLHAFLE
jgi:hypothetical protein